MRLLGFIFLVLILIGTAVYLYITLVVSKLSFKISLNRIEIGNINLDTLVSGTSFLKLKTNLEIINNSRLRIAFSDLRINIVYNGAIVASTPSEYTRSRVEVPSNAKVYTVEPINLYINPRTIAMIGVIKSGQPVRFDYSVSVKIFGIRYIYNDFFEYKFSMYQQ